MRETKAAVKKRTKLLSLGHAFVAPAVLLIIIMAFYPTMKVVSLSLHELDKRTKETEYVALDNYKSLVNVPIFGKAVKQTIYFSVFSAIGHIFFGFLIALYMNANINRNIRGLCRMLILIPWALSPVVVSIITQLWSYPPISPVTKIFRALNISAEFAPLGSPKTAMKALITINVWQFTPFYMLMILTGLQSIPPELFDAAKVDGASFVQQVRYVIIPHARNQLLTLLLFDLVTTAAYFDLVWLTTQGGPVRSTEVLATYTYRLAFWSMNWNKAAATGVILLIISLIIASTVVMIMERGERRG